ncbi:hypothetical protein AB0C19_22295 [Micromonospora sp. NPDC048842]
MEDPALLPKLDGVVVRVGDNEWIGLPDAWVVAHRSILLSATESAWSAGPVGEVAGRPVSS